MAFATLLGAPVPSVLISLRNPPMTTSYVPTNEDCETLRTFLEAQHIEALVSFDEQGYRVFIQSGKEFHWAVPTTWRGRTSVRIDWRGQSQDLCRICGQRETLRDPFEDDGPVECSEQILVHGGCRGASGEPVSVVVARPIAGKPRWKRRRLDEPMPIPPWGDLDPLIAPLVKFLYLAGYETTMSCQGGEGHERDYPTVAIASRVENLREIGDSVARVLLEEGWRSFFVEECRHYYSSIDPEADMGVVRLVFFSLANQPPLDGCSL